MVCIYCGHDTKVTNSRDRVRNPSVWRRRACKTCVAQFSSIETPDYATAFVVRGSNSRLYPFHRDKLFLSLHKSLSHRQDAIYSATQLTETVIGRLIRHKKLAQQGVLTRERLARVSHEVLKRYDPLSAHTYKAYHQSSLG